MVLKVLFNKVLEYFRMFRVLLPAIMANQNNRVKTVWVILAEADVMWRLVLMISE